MAQFAKTGQTRLLGITSYAMHRIRLILWLILTAVLPCSAIFGQDQDQPRITVVHPGVEALRADLLFLIGLTSKEEQEFGADVDGALEDVSTGINIDKPVRIDMQSDSQPVNYLFWIPYADQDDFLYNLDSLGWPPFQVPGVPNFYLIDDPFEQGWIRFLPEQNYAILALTTPENHEETKQQVLAAGAPGPEVLRLQDLSASILATLRNSRAGDESQVKRRETFSRIRNDDIAAVQQRPAESKSEFNLRKGRWSIFYDEMERAYIEALGIEFWSNLDRDKTTLSVSFDASAIAMTSLEESIAEFGQVPDAFAAIQPLAETVLSGRLNVSVDNLRKKNATEFLDLLSVDVNSRIDESTTLQDEEKQATRTIFDDVITLFRDGFASGNVNGFVEASHDGTEFTMVGAVSAPGSARLTETLKQLPSARSGNMVDLNVSTADDIAIHKISLAEGFVALADQLFGVGREFFIGIGRDQVWLATGPGAEELMQSKIAEAQDAKMSEVLLSVEVRLAPWVNRLHELADESEIPQVVEERAPWREKRARLKQLSESVGGEDQLTMKVNSADGKVSGRAQVTQGLLRFVGRQIAKMAKENLDI